MRRSKSPPNPIPHWCLSKVSRTLSLLDEITLTAPPHGRVERRQTFRIRRPSCQSRAHSTTDSLTERRASGDFRSILLLFLIFPDHRLLSIARPLSRPRRARALHQERPRPPRVLLTRQTMQRNEILFGDEELDKELLDANQETGECSFGYLGIMPWPSLSFSQQGALRYL